LSKYAANVKNILHLGKYFLHITLCIVLKFLKFDKFAGITENDGS